MYFWTTNCRSLFSELSRMSGSRMKHFMPRPRLKTGLNRMGYRWVLRSRYSCCRSDRTVGQRHADVSELYFPFQAKVSSSHRSFWLGA
jgi:hypothetical protein